MNYENTPMNDYLLTVSEVAAKLRVDHTTVRRWVRLGALEGVALPHAGKRRQFRIRYGTLKAMLGE